MLLPPLRRLSTILATKSYLSESLAPARLDAQLPGIGCGWASLLGTLSHTFYQLQIYAAQFESLAARWEQERFDLLQPDEPGVYNILVRLSIEQLKDVGAKEVELLGISSGSGSLAGGSNYIYKKAGADSSGGGKQDET